MGSQNSGHPFSEGRGPGEPVGVLNILSLDLGSGYMSMHIYQKALSCP